MTKLTNAEKDKLDNTCGNLRVTKLGTHVKSLEDFVNEMQLDTQADTVAEAINELYHMFVNKDCSSIQIPPPGFFTLWGNDEDGKLYCYYNDEDHPPVFQHIEDDSSDLNGTLYLYIADPLGDNHYRLEVGQYIAVRHLQDYYKKTECDAKYPVTVEKQATATSGYAATYVVKQNGSQVGAKINIPKDFFLKNGSVKTCTTANVPVTGYKVGDKYLDMEINVNDGTETTKHMYILVKDLADVYVADEVSLTLSNNNVFSVKDLGVSTAKLADSSVTTAKIKNGNVTNEKLATAVQNAISEKATTSYVDQQIANIEGDIEVDFASKADVNHSHLLDDINIDGALTANDDLNNYTDVGLYICSKPNGGTLANKPFTGTFGGLIENKKGSSGSIIQIFYKVTTRASTYYDIYFREYTSSGWGDWVRILTNNDIMDNLNSTSTTSALSAYQGKVLNDALAGKADSNHTHTKSEISDFPTSMTPTSHTHMLKDISITSAIGANSDLNDLTDVGIYTCSKTNSGTLANKPYSSNYSCIIENKLYASGSIVQFVYKVTTNATTCYDSYFRCYTANTWTDWIRVYTNKDFVVSDSLTDTSAKNALSAKQGKALNDRLNTMQTAYNNIVAGNSTSATTVTSLPSGWSGTVRYYCRNGFMIVTYEGLQKTSTGTSLETLFSLGVNNDLGYDVFDNGSTAISDDGVLVQVSANGAFRARCLKANTPKYGHIIFPFS